MPEEQKMAERIEHANKILASFVPGVVIYQHNRRLRMKWGNHRVHDFPANLRDDGSWPQYGYRQRPCGGTGFQAIAQVIRYIRDLSRLPLCTWEYWSGETVKLGSKSAVDLIRAAGYDDPAKTRCVLCGTNDYATRGLDWWSLDGVTGPCCRKCSHRHPPAKAEGRNA